MAIKNPNDIIQETHSDIFTAISRLINDVNEGITHTRKSCIASIPNRDPAYAENIEKYLNSIFYFTDNNGKISTLPTAKAKLRLNAPIPFLPVPDELIWLKTMLLDNNINFLISDKLREKMLSKLADIEAIPLNEIQAKDEKLSIINELPILDNNILKTFWQALITEKKVSYTYIDNNSYSHNGILSPVRLEYDAANQKYMFIMWNHEENRAIKINPAGIKQLQLTNEDVPYELPQLFEDFLNDKRAELTIEIKQEKNAPERAFTMFAPYDKDAMYDEENNKYILTIHYYSFDQQEIIDKIMSLGQYATVTAPEYIRKIIVEKWLTASHIFCND